MYYSVIKPTDIRPPVAPEVPIIPAAGRRGWEFPIPLPDDFFGSGSDTGDMKYRIQHLYGQLYGFKAGFTYGVFEDPDSWPDTVDYEGPNSVLFSRRPVAQYTHAWSENWNTTFGIEKPDIFDRPWFRTQPRHVHADTHARPRL